MRAHVGNSGVEVGVLGERNVEDSKLGTRTGGRTHTRCSGITTTLELPEAAHRAGIEGIVSELGIVATRVKEPQPYRAGRIACVRGANSERVVPAGGSSLARDAPREGEQPQQCLAWPGRMVIVVVCALERS